MLTRRRKYIKQKQSHQKIQLSAIQTKKSIRIPNEQLEQEVQKTLKVSHQNFRTKLLKNIMFQYIGKNYPAFYKKEYNFLEQWQNSQKNNMQSYSFLYNQSKLTQISSMIIMLSYTITLWYRSVDFFFTKCPAGQINFELLYLINLVAQVLDGTMKSWIYKLNTLNICITQILKINSTNLVSFIVVLLAYLQVQPFTSSVWVIIQIVNFYFLFTRARQLYQFFRFKNVVLAYDYQIKVFDLIFSLIMVAHFFAIVLYLSTTLGYDRNWLQLKDLQGQNKIQVYLYSFYYCTTTILTVGYGDLTPQNVAEVAIVIWVQIFGIVTFAYIINQIGYTLGQVRKERQVLDKDLMTMKKMKHYYKIDTDLMDEARSCLINQTDNVKDQLTPEEQNSLIMKLNEDLRNSIYMENSLSVIKSSIFFLCRWSKAFQTAISSKLQHKLFSPEERIYQPPGKERIYIIRLGRIEIYPEKRGSRKEHTNILKKVEVELSDEVCDNCYGYTAVISKTPVNLKAIAKKFTSCYFIEKDKFFDCTKERYSDEEYLHEIKDKIQLSASPFSFQVPNLTNNKLHYNPTKHKIILMFRAKDSVRCKRKFISRQNIHFLKSNLVASEQYQQQLKKIIYSSACDLEMIQTEKEMQIQNSQEDEKYENTIVDNKKQGSYIERMKILRTPSKSPADIMLQLSVRAITKNFTSYFEQYKQYDNYYKFNNMSEVIRKYDISIYRVHTYFSKAPITKLVL